MSHIADDDIVNTVCWYLRAGTGQQLPHENMQKYDHVKPPYSRIRIYAARVSCGGSSSYWSILAVPPDFSSKAAGRRQGRPQDFG